MQIVCPHCSSTNNIKYAENITCGKCKKTLTGHLYKRFSKPLISATTALVIGAYGTWQFVAETRYPVDVEYELVDACINASQNSMDSARRIYKTQICVCALEKTMKEVSYKEMKRSESEFQTRFRAGVTSCR